MLEVTKTKSGKRKSQTRPGKTEQERHDHPCRALVKNTISRALFNDILKGRTPSFDSRINIIRRDPSLITATIRHHPMKTIYWNSEAIKELLGPVYKQVG